MPTFLTPIDHSNLELKNALLQNLPTVSLPSTNRAGQIVYDSTLNLPAWNHGAGFYYIYRPSITHITSTITAVIRDASGNFAAGTITAALAGNASTATKLGATKNIGISGTKVTATAAAFDGSADVNINITALSVAAGDIGLTNGSFIVGNGSNVGAVTAKSAIPLSGFGAAAASVAMGGNKITGLGEPTGGQDAATKNYVDAAAQGLDVKQSVRLATTLNLGADYVSGTLTNNNTAAPLVIDGIPTAIGDRVLVRNQVDAKQNGIYVVYVVGTASIAWALTRAEDFNASSDIAPGAFTFVEEGNTLADTGWVLSSDGALTLDTSNLTWVQFSGAGSYLAGRGIIRAGNTFHFAQDANYTIGSLPYATGTTTIGMLTAVAAGNALISNGVGAAPSWGKISLSTVAQIGALSILGNGSGITANVETLTGATDQVLRVNSTGTALGFGAINLASSSAVTGSLSPTNGGTGSSFIQFTGPGTSLRTYSLTDRSCALAAHVTGTFTGDNSQVTFLATHNLNSRHVVAALYNESTNSLVYTDVLTTPNTVNFTFAVAPTNGTTYRWVVVGY